MHELFGVRGIPRNRKTKVLVNDKTILLFYHPDFGTN